MKMCLIANDHAGSGCKAHAIEPFSTRKDCEVRLSSSHTNVSQLARRAVDDGFDRIIVAGGDGTLSQVVNGIAPDFAAVELAVLPLGTGNDFARSLGITADRLDEAITVATRGAAHDVDLIKIVNGTTIYCLNAATGGFGGKIARDVASDDKVRWGAFAYWMTAVSKLIALDEYRLSLQLDDTAIALNVYGIAIANGRFVGGGFPIAPSAVINDGLLEITAIPILPTMELMAAGLNFTLGRDPSDDRLETFQSRKVHVFAEPNLPFSIDGEPLAAVEATFELVPRALRVVVGPHPVAVADCEGRVGLSVA